MFPRKPALPVPRPPLICKMESRTPRPSRYIARTACATPCPPRCGDTVTIRFRVGGVFKNKKIAVYLGDTCIFSRKRPVLAPGEMETVRLKGADLRAHPDASCLTVTLEEA